MDRVDTITNDLPQGWCLYLIECANGAWYAGITNDLTRRYAAHAAGRGARFTRANPPARLLGARAYADRAAASRAEWQIKQLPRARKLAFLTALESAAVVGRQRMNADTDATLGKGVAE